MPSKSENLFRRYERERRTWDDGTLKIEALAAVWRYVMAPSNTTLAAATAAVAAYRSYYRTPLLCEGFLWTVDGAGDLVKFKTTLKREGLR